MNLIQQMDDFRRAVLAFYQSGHALQGLGGTSADHLAVVLDAIKDPLPLNTSHTAAQVPATSYWPELIAQAAAPFDEIIRTAGHVADHFNWRINKSYLGIFEDRFFDNEAFVEVIGPNGLLICDDCRVGFLILGRDIYYPKHNHEATELYHTVIGTGLWSQSDGPERPKAPNTAIYHEEWENHTMRTTDPLLNLWSWTGAIGNEAQAS